MSIITLNKILKSNHNESRNLNFGTACTFTTLPLLCTYSSLTTTELIQYEVSQHF